MKHPRLFVSLFSAVCLVAVVPLASAQANQEVTIVETPIDDHWSPADYPCLFETIHVTGLLLDRYHVVINSKGGYSWQLQESTRDMSAEGENTGIKYALSGPLSVVENGSIDEPYPVEFTFHDIVHLVGPGHLTGVYIRYLNHVSYDPATGEVKAEVLKDDVICK